MKREVWPTLRTLFPASHPGFEMTFICNGRDFKAFVRARNQQAAAHEALIELAQQCPDFDPENARLSAAIQTL